QQRERRQNGERLHLMSPLRCDCSSSRATAFRYRGSPAAVHQASALRSRMMASAMRSEGNLGTRALVVPLEGPSEGGRRADHGEVSPPLPSMDGRFLVDCSNQSIGAVVVGKGTAPTIASRGTPTPSRI